MSITCNNFLAKNLDNWVIYIFKHSYRHGSKSSIVVYQIDAYSYLHPVYKCKVNKNPEENSVWLWKSMWRSVEIMFKTFK